MYITEINGTAITGTYDELVELVRKSGLIADISKVEYYGSGIDLDFNDFPILDK